MKYLSNFQLLIMKYILRMLLFFCFTFTWTNADYKIYFEWEYYNNIITNDILHEKINWVDSESIYFNELWYQKINNNDVYDLHSSNNIPIGFFSNNIKTVTKSSYSNFTEAVWFIWSNNTYVNNWDIINAFPTWFFNKNIYTDILKVNPEYNLWVWFIEILDLEVKKKKVKKIIEDITYKYFFEELLRKNSKLDYLRLKYHKDEYTLFINNIVSLLIEWIDYDNLIISLNEQNSILKNIEKSDFKKNLSILMTNLKIINKGFKSFDNYNSKKYIIKYFLN